MKIILATLAIEPESRNENNRNAAYSLGLGYLHSTLEAAGHQVKTLFLNNVDYSFSDAGFFSAVEEMKPQAAGFQIFSMNRVATFAAIEKLHSLYPEIRIVVGGVHASIMYEQILIRFPYVVAVIGEGELTLAELLEYFSGTRTLESVNGLAFFHDGQVKLTSERALIEDLDTLPEPKHDVFFESELGRNVAHIISSRGCPFDCTFCCLKAISRRRYRARSPENVAAEIEKLKAKYPRLTEIQFHDDTLLLDNARVIALCKLLVKKDLKLDFACSARVKPVSEEMFYWMQKAGFTKVMFGLETGSEKLLRSIHKGITKDDVLNLFKILKPYDFNVTTFLMCGFPGETDETVRETIELVRATQKIKYNLVAGVGKLWVYPGTEVYRIMKDAGKINDEFWMGALPVPYFTVEHDLETLKKFEKTMVETLSFLSIFSFRGFFLHFLRMPFVVLKFFIKPRNKKILLSVLAASAQRNFPKVYKRIYGAYRNAVAG
ncbi:MAG: hypothetical protein A2X28_01860 [Elusimicrobia bacterium GWA2_56_46]|nr:MAG: hypothetical protein A2X28_01860 [Elusimicrobia bacterium GWA2_56_46]OGR55484.1 MAG: hypothetical protein A2X39_01105 [Elusimicrobia bacterium GWC2_56_31]HBW21952.1 hypothetical protein [Elusimicrobiota bacterium]